MRLAAVLAEIAQNEANSAFTKECPEEDKVEGLGENPLRGQAE
jgi:hypothetical protein